MKHRWLSRRGTQCTSGYLHRQFHRSDLTITRPIRTQKVTGLYQESMSDYEYCQI